MDRQSYFSENLRNHVSRRTRTCMKLTVALLVLVPMLLTPTGTAQAQGGTVSGVVLDRGQTPLPNAQVTVQGTRLGSQTDANGRFRIGGVNGTSAVLEIRRLGYKMATATASVGTETQVSMEPASINLDAVVVTGQPGSTAKRTLGVDITQIDASNITAKAPINNFQNLINGRAPGVTILQNSGVIGSGATVRIRGVSSFALSNTPLIYVDGIRVDNAQGTGPQNQSFGASTTTRWNDFSPDDIESIEIVKGPAAATLYGTEAGWHERFRESGQPHLDELWTRSCHRADCLARYRQARSRCGQPHLQDGTHAVVRCRGRRRLANVPLSCQRKLQEGWRSESEQPS